MLGNSRLPFLNDDETFRSSLITDTTRDSFVAAARRALEASGGECGTTASRGHAVERTRGQVAKTVVSSGPVAAPSAE